MSGLGLQTPKPPHRSNRCGTGRWVVSWECHISAPASAPGTPLVCQSRTPTPTPRVGFASGRPTPTPTDSDFSGHGLRVTFTASFARCLLFDSHRGHTLFPEWADTRTASFGRSATGFVTTGPTLVYVPSCDKNVWELPL